MDPKDLEKIDMDEIMQIFEETMNAIQPFLIPVFIASTVRMAIKKISPPQIWKIYVPDETGIWKPVDGSWETEAEARRFYAQNMDKFRNPNGTVKVPMLILAEAE